jgi:hypothetical protein
MSAPMTSSYETVSKRGALEYFLCIVLAIIAVGLIALLMIPIHLFVWSYFIYEACKLPFNTNRAAF